MKRSARLTLAIFAVALVFVLGAASGALIGDASNLAARGGTALLWSGFLWNHSAPGASGPAPERRRRRPAGHELEEEGIVTFAAQATDPRSRRPDLSALREEVRGLTELARRARAARAPATEQGDGQAAAQGEPPHGEQPAARSAAAESAPPALFLRMTPRAAARLIGEAPELDEADALRLLAALGRDGASVTFECLTRLYPERASRLAAAVLRGACPERGPMRSPGAEHPGGAPLFGAAGERVLR